VLVNEFPDLTIGYQPFFEKIMKKKES